jgi:glycerophosphoryl diester phosphodiesterase
MSSKFSVVAHRGYSSQAPENTLAAFERAIESGSDMIEIDITLSEDGHFIVIHDDTLDRTTDGRGFVAHHSLEQIKRLDAGSWHSVEFAGQKLLTINEVLEKIAPRIGLNIEIKPLFTLTAVSKLLVAIHKLVEDVESSGLTDTILFSSFNFFVLEHLRSLSANVRLGVLYCHPFSEFDPIQVCGLLKAYSLHPHISLTDAPLVSTMHQIGVKVMPYTLNDTEMMRNLIFCGIDGAFSDYPERLRFEADAYR